MKTLPILKDIKGLNKLEELGILIEFEALNEEIAPDFDDIEDIKEIERKYNAGNMAAWFCAHVTVSYRGLDSDDYLGCCSYNSFKDFTGEENGYYVDMINNCIGQINNDVQFANATIKKFWDIRKAKNILRPYGLHIVTSNQLVTI